MSRNPDNRNSRLWALHAEAQDYADLLAAITTAPVIAYDPFSAIERQLTLLRVVKERA